MNSVLINYVTGRNEDYDSGSFLINIPANATRVPFIVLINDDNMYEGNENFTLTIHTLSANIMVGKPAQTTVTIIDNDCKCNCLVCIVVNCCTLNGCYSTYSCHCLIMQ